jgi:hypothetical protein
MKHTVQVLATVEVDDQAKHYPKEEVPVAYVHDRLQEVFGPACLYEGVSMPSYAVTAASTRMQLESLPSFPAGENPFYYDAVRMGEHLGTNVLVMFDKFPRTDFQPYIILHDITTGQRLRITFAVPAVKEGA